MKANSLIENIQTYMSDKYTLIDVYNQIQAKECGLKKRERDFVILLYTKCL